MHKAPEAFRTISEVSELLETPPHVLRFWESRFSQLKPVKRAGGRRYYRPSDLALLSGIKQLLHTDGMTIRGVQKLLNDNGVRHVLSRADPAHLAANDGDAPADEDATVPAHAPVATAPEAPAEANVPPAAASDTGLPKAQSFPAMPPALPQTEAVIDMPPPPSPETPSDDTGLTALAAHLRKLDPEALRARRDALAQVRARLVALHARRREALVAGRI